jgi:hypothetical protein
VGVSFEDEGRYLWKGHLPGCFTGDVLHIEHVGGLFCNVMDASKDGIDFWIVTASFPPSLNTSFVVTIDSDSLGPSTEFRKGLNKKFESNSFCSSNISPVRLLSW